MKTFRCGHPKHSSNSRRVTITKKLADGTRRQYKASVCVTCKRASNRASSKRRYAKLKAERNGVPTVAVRAMQPYMPHAGYCVCGHPGRDHRIDSECYHRDPVTREYDCDCVKHTRREEAA